MRLLLSLFAVACFSTSVLACSADDSTPSDAASDGGTASTPPAFGAADPAVAKALCDSHVARDQACPAVVQTNGATDVGACLADANACQAKLFTLEGTKLFASCYGAAKGCDDPDGPISEDDCFEEAGAALPANPVRDTYLNACQAKLTSCAKGSFSDDWCSGGGDAWQVFTDAAYQRFGACFAKSCDDIDACLQGEYGAVCPDQG